MDQLGSALTTRVVLHASVTLSAIFPDERVPRAGVLLEGIRERRVEALVPAILLEEVLNGLLGPTARRRFVPEERQTLSELVLEIPIRFDSMGDTANRARRIWSLAETHGLTAYDAAYLELARRMKLPRATVDRDLAAAAVHESVEVAA